MSNIMSNKCLGLIASYDFSTNGTSGSAIINQAIPSLANGFNPSNWNYTINSNTIRYKDGLLNNNKTTSLRASSTTPTSLIWSFCIKLKMLRSKSNNGLSGTGTTGTSSGYNGSIQLNSSSIVFVSSIGSGYSWSLANSAFINIHSCLCFISDGTKIYLYVNGIYHSFITPNSTQFNIRYLAGYNGDTNRQIEAIISNAKFLNRVITEREIRDYNNYFASKPVFKENFTDYAVGSTKTSQYPIVNGKISELTTNKFLPKGTKVILSSGNCQTPLISTVAYGTWTFNMYKPTQVSIISVGLISLNKNNYEKNTYLFEWWSDNSIFIGYTNNDSYSTDVTSRVVIAHNQMLKVKIIRDYSGKFTIFINGLKITSGTNNIYTRSSYFKIGAKYYLFDGTWINNINISQGITI